MYLDSAYVAKFYVNEPDSAGSVTRALDRTRTTCMRPKLRFRSPDKVTYVTQRPARARFMIWRKLHASLRRIVASRTVGPECTPGSLR